MLVLARDMIQHYDSKAEETVKNDASLCIVWDAGDGMVYK